MSERLRIGDDEREVSVELREGVHIVRVGDRTYEVRVLAAGGDRLDLAFGDRRVRAHVARDGERTHVHLLGDAWIAERAESARRARGALGAHEGDVQATMPGQVRAVLAEVGQAVSRGDTLVVLEAMKMELRLRASRDGRVERIACQVGDVVERGQVLVEVA